MDDKQKIGIGGFTAYVSVREVETKSLDAPDIPLEDGSFASDHLIKKPYQAEIEGRISDVFIRLESEPEKSESVISGIGEISIYSPVLTPTQQAKITEISENIDAANALLLSSSGQSVFGVSGDKTVGNSYQKQFTDLLDYYYDNDQLFQIEVGGVVYDNMTITTRIITRDNKNGTAIDFKISIKQLIFTETVFSDISQYFTAPANGQPSEQTAGEVDKGLNNAPEVETSLASSIKSGISGLL